MAAFTPTEIVLSQLNNGTGQEYNPNDGVYAADINAAIEGAAWAQDASSHANVTANDALNAANTAKTQSDSALQSAQQAEMYAYQANTKSDSAAASAEDAVGKSDAAYEAAYAANNFVNALVAPPDLSEVNNIGTPSVSFVDNGEYKKFKFSNLKANSVKDVDFELVSETATEALYNVKTTLDDNTVVYSEQQVTIPKASVPMISEFAAAGQETPSADLMVGGFFFKGV